MAVTNRKRPLFLGSEGFPVEMGDADGIEMGELQVSGLSLAGITEAGVAHVDASGEFAVSLIVDADVDAAAAIAYSKLALSASIVDADISATAAIADTKLATISTAGKVENSATTATDANTASAIVARDASGDFSAGMITADLTGDVTGNADTASAWFTSRQVSFSGGDVTGSFSIDGSADVSNVDLTIEAGSVTNEMLAGSIANSKLEQIADAGMVADSALSANVALLDSTQTFSGAKSFDESVTLTGGASIPSGASLTITDAPVNSTDAVNKAYADLLSAGVSYKYAAEWDAPVSKADLLTMLPTLMALAGAPAVGDRFLVNSGSADADNGLWVLGGTSSAPTLTRPDDFAAGFKAAGAYIFCQKSFGGSPLAVVTANVSYICVNEPGADTVGTDAIDFTIYSKAEDITAEAPIVKNGLQLSLQYGVGLEVGEDHLKAKLGSGLHFDENDAIAPDLGSGLEIDANSKLAAKIGSGLQFAAGGAVEANVEGPLSIDGVSGAIQLDYAAGLETDGAGALKAKADETTLEVDAVNGIQFKSLPAEFKIDGTAVSANVTAENMGVLVDGISQLDGADNLHRHERVMYLAARDSTLAPDAFTGGEAVVSGLNGVYLADKSNGKVTGIVVEENEHGVLVALAGIISTAATAAGGENVYLGAAGALVDSYAAFASGDKIVKIGRALGDGTVHLTFQDIGVKA